MAERLSPFLERTAADHVAFWCPGCKETHRIRIGGERPGPVWGYNGNPEKPTFTPSILVRTGHHVPGWQGEDCWCTSTDKDGEAWGFDCAVCHTFVTDGMIQFLGDCTHPLAGQTVPLPPLPERADG